MKYDLHTDKAQGLVLRAISDTLELDLAMAPMIIASDKCDQNSKLLEGVASGLGFNYTQIGANFTVEDVKGIADLDKGYSGVVFQVEHGNPAIVEVLRKIEITACFKTILCFNYPLYAEDEALDQVEMALSIHRANIPTARFSDHVGVEQPMLLIGDVSLEDSKCGERYFRIETEFSNFIFRIEALQDGQDDDEFNDVLKPISRNMFTKIAVRLEVDKDKRLYAAQDSFEVIS